MAFTKGWGDEVASEIDVGIGGGVEELTGFWTEGDKAAILDQTVIAGIGNIYADEALWLARLHPTRRADTLTRPEIQRLHHAIRTVLARAVAAEGTTLGTGATNFYSVAGRRGRNADALQVFRRTGDPCPRCGHVITRLVVGQRGTHVCEKCQQAP